VGPDDLSCSLLELRRGAQPDAVLIGVTGVLQTLARFGGRINPPMVPRRR